MLVVGLLQHSDPFPGTFYGKLPTSLFEHIPLYELVTHSGALRNCLMSDRLSCCCRTGPGNKTLFVPMTWLEVQTVSVMLVGTQEHILALVSIA